MKKEKIVLQDSYVKWDGGTPYVVETYNDGKNKFTIGKYFSKNDLDFEKFILQLIRDEDIPIWIKNNFQNLRKMLKTEIKERKRKRGKLSQEQRDAFCKFFNDDKYFEYDDEEEFYCFEEQKVFMNFIKSILDTDLYETFCRKGKKKRIEMLEKYGRE